MISLEPMVYNPADKRGDQFKAAVALTIGDWVYTSGTSAVNGVTYGLVRKATTGLYSTTGTGAIRGNRLGVVFREPQAYRSDDEVSDTDWNTLSVADTVIIFYGGEFRTSRFNTTNINAGTPPGSSLWVDMDGVLDIGTTAGQKFDKPVAQLIAYHEAGATDYIDFRILL